jgi:Uncharacterized protein conserved in bacteria
MRQQIITMLELQEAMNSKVNAEWRQANYEWYRAIWVECAELMDHYGWKWWKKQSLDTDQVVLELIDIWHFGLSIRLLGASADVQGYQSVAEKIENEFDLDSGHEEFRVLLEQFTEVTLRTKAFSVSDFSKLLGVAGVSFEQLFNSYVGKNVLNIFRQNHGYKDGSYQKTWHGKEDNEHLVEALAKLDPKMPEFGAALYQSLKDRYPV